MFIHIYLRSTYKYALIIKLHYVDSYVNLCVKNIYLRIIMRFCLKLNLINFSIGKAYRCHYESLEYFIMISVFIYVTPLTTPS